MNPINLRARFGNKYRIEIEEGGSPNDAWAMLIPCVNGHIYLHGPKTLGAATRSRGPVANRLAALPGVTVTQDGSDGINVTFAAKDFDAVAAVMRPKTRRRLSEAAKAKLIEAGERFRYGAGASGADGLGLPTAILTTDTLTTN